MFGVSKLAGTVKGGTVRFAYTIDVQGMQFELRASGVAKDKDNIAGSLEAPNPNTVQISNRRRLHVVGGRWRTITWIAGRRQRVGGERRGRRS